MEEKNVEKLFKSKKREIKKIFPGVTNNMELNVYCRRAFGKQFKGVYSSDNMPKLRKYQSMIINLDPLAEPGSHWVCVCKSADYELIFYDSFARNPKKILNSLYQKYPGYLIRYDKKDKEQKKSEVDCGANCIAFLYVFYYLGITEALMV